MTLTTLGKYELLKELGHGGFGTVYRARDTILDVERAVKVLHPALVTSQNSSNASGAKAVSRPAWNIPTLFRSMNWARWMGAIFWR